MIMITITAVVGLVASYVASVLGVDSVIEAPMHWVYDRTGIPLMFMYGALVLGAISVGIVVYYRWRDAR